VRSWARGARELRTDYEWAHATVYHSSGSWMGERAEAERVRRDYVDVVAKYWPLDRHEPGWPPIWWPPWPFVCG
jgi:hypothetical protein